MQNSPSGVPALVLLFAALAVATPAAAQSGWADFARICTQNGGTPYRGGEGGHESAWCDYNSSAGASSAEPNIVRGTIYLFRELFDDSDRVSEAIARARRANRAGVDAYDAGRYEEAVRHFTDATRAAPDNDNYSGNLSVARQRLDLELAERRQTDTMRSQLAGLSQDLNQLDGTRPRSDSLDFMASAAPSSTGGVYLGEPDREFTVSLEATRGAYDSQLRRLNREIASIHVPSPITRTIQEGVIMGMLATPQDAQRLRDLETSPLSGRRYNCPPSSGSSCRANDLEPGQSLVVAFGRTDADSELMRAVADNLTFGAYTLNSAHGRELVRQLEGTHFNSLIAHSNGATITEALIRSGTITVDELNIAGGDRSLANLQALQQLLDAGTVRRVRVFINPGDPIPGLSSTIASWPIRRQVEYLASQLRGQGSSANRVEVCLLGGTVGQDLGFEAHYLREAYFPNMRAGNCTR